jgi:hypothetical protein
MKSLLIILLLIKTSCATAQGHFFLQPNFGFANTNINNSEDNKNAINIKLAKNPLSRINSFATNASLNIGYSLKKNKAEILK